MQNAAIHPSKLLIACTDAKMPHLDTASERINTDKLQFGVNLKPHQRALLLKTLQVEQQAFGAGNPAEAIGFMTDRPGAGKTYVMLALIYIADKMALCGSDGAGCTIIVTPHNIHTQWLDSLNTLCRQMSDSLRWKPLVSYSDVSSVFFGAKLLEETDILLTTSLYYDSVAASLQSAGLRVRRLIVDEVDSIRGVLRTRLPATMTWLVSGTMRELLESGDIKLGAYEIKKDVFAANECCCAEAFITSALSLHDPCTVLHELTNVYIDKLLVNVLSPLQMQAVNGLDFSSKSMGLTYTVQTPETDERLATKGLYLDLHECIARNRDAASQIRNAITAGSDIQVALECKLADLETEIRCAEEKVVRLALAAKEHGICTLCFQKHSAEHVPCSHVAKSLMHRKHNKARVLTELLAELIADKDKHVIVFSLHNGAFLAAQNFLDKMGVNWKDLDGGNVASIDAAVSDFVTGRAQVLFIASAQLGVGLDLQVTTDIIFCHAVSESIQRQVVGRAQRLGRIGTLTVHHLVHQNEA